MEEATLEIQTCHVSIGVDVSKEAVDGAVVHIGIEEALVETCPRPIVYDPRATAFENDVPRA